MTFPANENAALHSVGKYKYNGIARIVHTMLAPANTQVQNHAWPTSRALDIVGMMRVMLPRSCMVVLAMSWKKSESDFVPGW